MGKSLREKINELPIERQEKIEKRAQELIALETERQKIRQELKVKIKQVFKLKFRRLNSIRARTNARLESRHRNDSNNR
ncbi:hypothetical protein QUB80_14065 [Chlorogloeopsis sp. ULAP01]|uniref:hypothetical protein n=1 Tax=Chlorogloeopsis sp. ULAP01 TaxID=3056483 RepID=UPI0025AA4A49|nr:hypothetical protein [Chlorogloeopsis sp. ULAP01]MDM9381826.1 hypothetical protein [Chlorogloeopsis sp. ULAP01]